MKVTDEMVQRAVMRYFERTGWTLIGDNMRSALEAALFDVPEPDLAWRVQYQGSWLTHTGQSATERIAELEQQGASMSAELTHHQRRVEMLEALLSRLHDVAELAADHHEGDEYQRGREAGLREARRGLLAALERDVITGEP